MKKMTWVLLGIASLVIMFFILRYFRYIEGFSQPSITCPSSIVTGNQWTPADYINLEYSMQNDQLSNIGWIDGFLNWSNVNFPSETNGLLVAAFLVTYSVNSGVTFVPDTNGNMVIKPDATMTFPKDATSPFLIAYAKALNVMDFSPGIQAPNPNASPAMLATYLSMPSSEDVYRIEEIWSYFYGACAPQPPPPPPAPPAPPAPAAPTAPPAAPTTTPASFGPVPTPVPSNSSTVSVPSPCHAGIQSIPGGTMEFKCFES